MRRLEHPTQLIQEVQEIDGLISQARVQYGKVAVSQHELGATLLKIREATKAQGSRKGKGFETCLVEIGISKTQAYRFMKSAETGEPVDYDNDFVPNGTKLDDTRTPEELAGVIREAVEMAMITLEHIVKETDDLRIILDLMGKPLATHGPLAWETVSPVDWYRTDPFGFLKFVIGIIDRHAANLNLNMGGIPEEWSKKEWLRVGKILERLEAEGKLPGTSNYRRLHGGGQRSS
jgi:hypothetical protein